MATLQLVFRPVNLLASTGVGLDTSNLTGAYHEFLLYTNDSNQMFYVRGGPDNIPNAQSSWGKIEIDTGEYIAGSPDFPVISSRGDSLDTSTFNSWQKITITSGSQARLDQIWNNSIVPNALTIDAKGLPYYFTSQNSNSVASEVLRMSGFDAPNTDLLDPFALPGNFGEGTPWGSSFGDLPWAPGSQNHLGQSDSFGGIGSTTDPGNPAGILSGSSPTNSIEQDTLNSAGQITFAQFTDSHTGNVEQTDTFTYDSDGQITQVHIKSSVADFASQSIGLSASGIPVSEVVNWASGGSQLWSFAPAAGGGLVATTASYTGWDGSGLLTTQTNYNVDGTSQSTSWNPDGTSMVSYYNASSQLTETISYTSDAATINEYDLTTGEISYKAVYWTGAGLSQFYFDTSGTQPWSEIDNEYTSADGSGQTSQVTYYRDGAFQTDLYDQATHSIQTETFVNPGGSKTITTWDTENAQSWASQVTDEDAGGVVTTQTQYWHAGGYTETSYAYDGSVTSAHELYADGSYSNTVYRPDSEPIAPGTVGWEWTSAFYDPNNLPTQFVQQENDGTWSQEFYDFYGKQPWETLQYAHGPDGAITEETAIDHSGGTVLLFEDPYYQHAWNQVEVAYAANGQPISNGYAITIWNHDGSIVQTQFNTQFWGPEPNGNASPPSTITTITIPDGHSEVYIVTPGYSTPYFLTGNDPSLFGASDWTGGSVGGQYGDVSVDPDYGVPWGPGMEQFNPAASANPIQYFAVTADVSPSDIPPTPQMWIESQGPVPLDGGIDIDPIVLNLARGPITTTNAQTNGVSFDMAGTGAAQSTGWISSGEGFLVMGLSDPSAVRNGHAFISDLTQLSSLDTNQDGSISAADSDYWDISVWQPGADGSAGSLSSLPSLGITAIALQPTTVDQTDNGNLIKQTIQFLYANGSTGQGADVYFATGASVGFSTAPGAGNSAAITVVTPDDLTPAVLPAVSRSAPVPRTYSMMAPLLANGPTPVPPNLNS